MEIINLKIVDSMWEFIKKYYIDSIVYKQGYNIVNTLTWATFLIIAVILIYKYLSERLNFDEKFVLSNIPFIILGSSLRIVEDAGFLKPPASYLLMTPFIYVIVFSITFLSLILSLKISKNYWKIHGTIGVALSAFTICTLIVKLNIVNWWIMPASILSALVFTSIFYLTVKMQFFSKMRNMLSYTVFFSHMLDGSATFIGINYLGYWELHVLPRFLIENFGAWIMIPAKFTVFFVVLYILDSSEEDENLINFLKFVLVTLGMAPGIRDALRMTFSV